MYQRIRLIITVVLLTMISVVPVSANSAIKSWHGTDANDTYVIDEDCPVVCEKEDLVFDIGSFPSSYFGSKEELQAYDASVTAVYTLKNPTDSKIDVRLVFPFGEDPQYLYHQDYLINEDLDKYEILKNDIPVEKKIRYSLKTENDFDVTVDVERLRDDYLEDDFFQKDLPVFVYVYEVEGLEAEEYKIPECRLELNIDSSQYLIIGEMKSFINGSEDHVSAVYVPEGNGTLYHLYLLGEDLKEEPVWNNFTLNTEKVPGEVLLKEKKQITLEEMILSQKSDEMMLDVDWYNACIDYMKERTMLVYDRSPFGEMTYSLLRWYEYELSFEAGETLTNSVKAPIYPDINEYYEPAKYTYHYLLSPASTWADFSDLNITVSTKYSMIDNSTFAEEEGKYTLHYDHLPEEELSFTLSESSSPKHSGDKVFYIVIGIMAAAFVIFVLLVIGIIKLIGRLIRK